jgi:hypothetical protein
MASRVRFVLLAVVVYAVCALWATWPAVRHADDRYLALPAAGHGEAAAGDHLQLGWAFWLVGHQLERGSSPLSDPYSFRPEASAPPNTQGWLLGVPYWPLERLGGPIRAYNLVVLLSVLAAGGLACWWLRSLGLGRVAALAGGVAFALAPYVVGQRTGHLLGLIAFLLPAVLLALERRRLVWAAILLAAIPASGQLHLALGAIPLALGYAWVRLPRARRGPGLIAAAPAGVLGLLVWAAAVRGSIAGGRSFAQVERYSAEVSDLVTRGVGAGIEELVFVGWVTPLLALAGAVVAWRRQGGLAVVLAMAAVVPVLLALGSNLPGYETLWRVLPPLHATRVPERLLPIAALATAALAAFAVDHFATVCCKVGWRRAVAGAGVVVAIALDVRVDVFEAVEPDRSSRAYAALGGEGRLLELPVIRPDVHYGSVYLAYARQSPRERPQGYSTLAPPAADRLARALEVLSCGRGVVPPRLGVRFVVVHRGVYAQRGDLDPSCPDLAEARLRADGWRLLARDGRISSWMRRERPTAGLDQASSAATSSRSRPRIRTWSELETLASTLVARGLSPHVVASSRRTPAALASAASSRVRTVPIPFPWWSSATSNATSALSPVRTRRAIATGSGSPST